MLRYVYPNVVDEDDEFIGLGRYLTTLPDDPRLGEGYMEARPHFIHFDEVLDAASILAPESFETTKQVYECKDNGDQRIGIGGSSSFAYLLALILRSRAPRWTNGDLDIWCTGVIRTHNGAPQLKAVFRNQFDVKLRAFLDAPEATLFLLPIANLTPEHQQACQRRNVRVIGLSHLYPVRDVEQLLPKTIVPLHGYELEALVEWLFPRQTRLQNPRDFTVKIRHATDHSVVGTGIAVSMEGQILTCTHLIEHALGMRPRQAAPDAEVLIYFPNARSGQAKTRRARVAAAFDHYHDDVVMLQLVDGPPPLQPEQLAILGDAAKSTAHPFRAYGYLRQQQGIAGYAQGRIGEAVEAPDDAPWKTEPIQLHFDAAHQDMSGAAVLDTERNRVVGLISTCGRPYQGSRFGWAINAGLFAQAPFHLSLDSPVAQPAVIPLRSVSASPTAQHVAAGEIAWQAAPPFLRNWVGRKQGLQQLCQDWQHADARIAGIVGFGGEGKSSLARKWVEGLRQGIWPDAPAPHAVFGWNFYSRPNLDQCVDALFRFLTADSLDPQRYPSITAKLHVINGYLYGEQQYLFVLDGLETLQEQDEDRYGLLCNADLRDFLLAFLTPGNRSFCLITSRLPLLDFIHYTGYRHHEIGSLTRAEARTLLRSLGVKPHDYPDAALDRVFDEWGCHALTLSLLAGYIVEQQRLPASIADTDVYARVAHILASYDVHLNTAERAFLTIFSAFRLPVAATALQAVFRDTALRICRPLNSLDDAAFQAMLTRLRRGQLVTLDGDTQRYASHPLVRAYYQEQMNALLPEERQALHQRIKASYLDVAVHLPANPSFEELTPLLEAVHHACCAGEYDDAYLFVFSTLNQGRYYLPDMLGGWETYLATLREFFPQQDFSRQPLLEKPAHQASLFHEVGFCFMSLGQLARVEHFYQRSLRINQQLRRWERVSLSYQNLAELYMHLGRLPESVVTAEQAVEHARRAKDREQERDALADLAWMHHLRGDNEQAQTYFQQSIIIQRSAEDDMHDPVDAAIEAIEAMAQSPDDAVSGSILHIIRYADFLRKTNNPNAARRIITTALTVCEHQGNSEYTALSQRVLGDLDAAAGQRDAAQKQFDRALTLIRSTTCRDILLDILVARGRWQARQPELLAVANAELQDALHDAVANGFRLYEVEIRLALAQVALTSAALSGNAAPLWEIARRELAQARQMSLDMGYLWGQREADRLRKLLSRIER